MECMLCRWFLSYCIWWLMWAPSDFTSPKTWDHQIAGSLSSSLCRSVMLSIFCVLKSLQDSDVINTCAQVSAGDWSHHYWCSRLYRSVKSSLLVLKSLQVSDVINLCAQVSTGQWCHQYLCSSLCRSVKSSIMLFQILQVSDLIDTHAEVLQVSNVINTVKVAAGHWSCKYLCQRLYRSVRS